MDDNFLNYYYKRIEAESDKAIKLLLDDPFGKEGSFLSKWFPKDQINLDKINMEVSMPQWLAERNELC